MPNFAHPTPKSLKKKKKAYVKVFWSFPLFYFLKYKHNRRQRPRDKLQPKKIKLEWSRAFKQFSMPTSCWCGQLSKDYKVTLQCQTSWISEQIIWLSNGGRESQYPKKLAPLNYYLIFLTVAHNAYTARRVVFKANTHTHSKDWENLSPRN